MTKLQWGILTPEIVSEHINFKRGNEWTYVATERDSMPDKQAEGVAYLWNLLSTQRLALLADEVGMGKTIQALGVASLLWKLKPNAKVLVMAPNRDICKGWMREFNTFVDLHYRQADHLVKNSVDGGPVPAVHFCQRLSDLASAVESGVGHLYFTTIYSLSGLLSSDEKNSSDKKLSAKRAAAKVRRRILKALEGGFDLVIVDEAHYLRNRSGNSQRVAAAEGFFGIEKEQLSSKYLLLTATPSHTGIGDIFNILSYFGDLNLDADCKVDTALIGRKLLEKYSLRRLRLLEGTHGANSKHQYRREIALPCEFKGRPNSELFFALYQKRLVADLRRTKENKKVMYGYLEGFESFGKLNDVGLTSDEGDNTEVSSKDWTNATDSELLHELSMQYEKQFKTYPEHPKYNSLVDACTPKSSLKSDGELSDYKHLVFVRRIPSVREITQRINERYDDLLANMIVAAWGIKYNSDQAIRWRESNWSLEGFKSFTSKIENYDVDSSEQDISDDENNNIKLASKIAELFVIKKIKGGQSDSALVRLRFSRPNYLFSLFLEPSSDYLFGGYLHYPAGEKPDYLKAALFERQKRWSDDTERKADRNFRAESNFSSELKTVWSLVYPFLNDSQKLKLLNWAEKNPTIAENFGNYLKAGFLHASPVMVELYCWFVRFRREAKDMSDAQKTYLGFYNFVAVLIKDSLLLRYFKAALDSFELLCGKIFDHGIHAWEEEWRPLKSLTSPAWYASGDTAADSRQRLILGFNSPFYPNVLIATSIFKEGVNLHMSCYQVHHYGMAGSPGDNEQRIGRVDRLFGCVNERLQNKEVGEADLKIFYPYLKSSVDEDQVASFIRKKYYIENQMDACLPQTFDKEIDFESVASWEGYLRKPIPLDNQLDSEPYPPKLFPYSRKSMYRPTKTHTPEEIARYIELHFKKILDPKTDSFRRLENSKKTGAKKLFIIDPLIQDKEVDRRQPILVEKSFDADLSSFANGTAYILSLVSPIAQRTNLEDQVVGGFNAALSSLEAFLTKYEADFPLIRACINEKATNSHFYLSLRVDLPVFSNVSQMTSLSGNEITVAFKQLKEMADALEYLLFDSKQDLKLSDLKDTNSNRPGRVERRTVSTTRGKLDVEWTSVISEACNVAKLSMSLSDNAIEQFCKQIELEKGSENSFHKLLQLNHQYPFMNFRTIHEQSFITTCFPLDDMQNGEEELLESWFGYLATSINS